MFTLVSPSHPLKALLPILVTEGGMVTLVRVEQFKKAPLPMLVTEFGMARSFISSSFKYK